MQNSFIIYTILFVFCVSSLFLLRSSLQKDEVYLNLVLEYIPETVYKVARQFAKSKQTIPINYIRVSKMLKVQLTSFHSHSVSFDNVRCVTIPNYIINFARF